MDCELYSTSSLSVASLRRELDDRGVAVWKAAEGIYQPIPVALSPTVVKANEWRDLVRDAQVVVEAFPKLMTWLQRPQQRRLFEQICGGLKGVEAWAVRSDPLSSWGHATMRVDLFWHQGIIKIIEVNATIPAMQAYSDQTTQAWLAAGATIDPGICHVSDNQDDLLHGILSLYRRDGGLLPKPRIAILHRHGDSQLGELQSLCRDWNDRGYKTMLVSPDQLSRAGDIWISHGEPCDIVYRHIFAWRIDDEQLLTTLKNSHAAHIYNPVSAHYETKAFLALLSQVADDPAIAVSIPLSDTELAAIKARVPWSRVIHTDNATTTAAAVGAKLDRLVLKRSLGYGGHHVIMGDSWNSPGTQTQLRSLMGRDCSVSFEEFMLWITHEDHSLWIAQERMSGARRVTEVLTRSGIETWDAWYDASVFINTGSRLVSGGGVSRVAKTPIVNIGSGGGLAPFILDDDPKPHGT